MRARHLVAVAAFAAFASALAFALRLGHSLSVDEPFMANAVRLPWSELAAVFRTDNAPFAYLLLRLWTGTFGDSELALRALSIAAYAIATLLTGLAAARRGPLAAITAAALAATSVRVGITHAATARPYALLATFAAAATLLTLQSFEKPPVTGTRTRLHFALLTTVHLFGLLTHPTYVFVLIACGLAATIWHRERRAPAALAPATALVLYIAGWGRVVWATLESQATSWMQPPTLGDVKSAYLSLWGAGPGFMLIGALLALALSNPSRVRDLFRDRRVKWAALATIVGWSVPIAISLLWRPVFLTARTPMLLLPFTAVFIAFLLSAVASRAAVLALVSVFLAAAMSQVVGAARAGDPTPTRASLQQILSDVACGETLVAVGLAYAPVDYYLPRLAAPGCVTVERFPANMLNWTRRVTDVSEMRRTHEDAVRLVTRLSSRQKTLWVLTADTGMGHEASDIFMAAIRGQLTCGDPVPRKGAFFDHVTRCEG
jgi:hypothetical protein